jgi:hypothetical protein
MCLGAALRPWTPQGAEHKQQPSETALERRTTMSRLRNYLLATSGLGILVVGLVLTSPPASNAVPGPHTQDVLVVNPTSLPVPTAAQGTTTIAGSVSVANTPAVTFAPGASVGIDPASNTVQLANTTANPVPVFNLNDASQPFQVGAGITQSGTNVSLIDIATVPAGHRLVIEFISTIGQVPPGQHVELMEIITVTDPFGGATHELLVNAQPPAVSGDFLFRASQQVKLYANAGSQVKALFRRSTSAGNATFGVTISGFLVPVL